MNPKALKKTFVFLGRFSPLHLGHQILMDKVISEKGEENCLVMIGSANSRNPRTPFSYEERERMVRSVYPEIEVLPLPDIQPELVIFDGSTNDKWLESIAVIEANRKTMFVFVGGSQSDLDILAQKFETLIAVDRFDRGQSFSATLVREALKNKDTKMITKLLDPRVAPLAIKYYEHIC